MHSMAFHQFPSCHEQDTQNQDDHAAASSQHHHLPQKKPQASISPKLVAENDPQKVPEKPHEQGFSPKSNSFTSKPKNPKPVCVLCVVCCVLCVVVAVVAVVAVVVVVVVVVVWDTT